MAFVKCLIVYRNRSKTVGENYFNVDSLQNIVSHGQLGRH